MVEVNLKIWVVEDGGVGGFMGWSGRGDGGSGGIDRTVAITQEPVALDSQGYRRCVLATTGGVVAAAVKQCQRDTIRCRNSSQRIDRR